MYIISFIFYNLNKLVDTLTKNNNDAKLIKIGG